ncbi:MAG: NAD(P)H-binding protein [Thermoplasmata archaeon]|nr:NAD(P)H-binding protein [Thermoplasmata archaeon]MCI4358815.1 NAD(P)H-binding protein [Thermoplasmata archaeon]
MSSRPRPRLLLVGGGGGFVGRALVRELAVDHSIRSLHRHASTEERSAGVEWVETDLGGKVDWDQRLRDVDAVVNVAWYRSGSEARFRVLYEGLERMLAASVRAGVARLIQVSVPEAPDSLETTLPYLVYKRRFDHSVERSGLSYAVLRPSALFGVGDKLLGVMMRSIHRYPFFPMFGDGACTLSPIAVTDLARVVREALDSSESGRYDLGGPIVYRYSELTDAMFAALGKRPRYWRLSARGSLRLASLLEAVGSSLLYRYEVEWLLSGRLGLPPAALRGRGLERLEPYLRAVAMELRGDRSPAGAAPPTLR